MQWKRAILRFILNNMERLDQEGIDAWLAGEIEVAPQMEEPLKSMPHRKLQTLCCIDHVSELSLVAVSGVASKQKIVGLVSYHLNPASQGAEIIFLVADAWQGKGIGTFLM